MPPASLVVTYDTTWARVWLWVGRMPKADGSGSLMPGQAMQMMPRAWSSSVQVEASSGPPSTANGSNSAARTASARAATGSSMLPDARTNSSSTVRP